MVHGCCSEYVQVHTIGSSISWKAVKVFKIAAGTVSQIPYAAQNRHYCSQALSQKQLQRSASKNDGVGRITKAGFKQEKKKKAG